MRRVPHPSAPERLRAACGREFLWEQAHASLPLFALARGDCRVLAQRVSCDQAIAGEGFFSLGMIADFDASLQAFGPASAQDCARFTFLRQRVVRAALRSLADRVEPRPGPNGTTLFDVPGGPLRAEDTPAPPRLLPMWDSVLLAYADRGRVVPPDYRPLIFRRNGDVLPTLLVDGYVAGVWRAVEGGIEARAFRRLDEPTWIGLATEASALQAFLAKRTPLVYRRYDHWWRKPMPAAEVRILPG